jgi:hypothetical protein
VRPRLELHEDCSLGNRDPRRGVDQVAKQVDEAANPVKSRAKRQSLTASAYILGK